jgi:Ca2+-binding EF-hand superfamily protein
MLDEPENVDWYKTQMIKIKKSIRNISSLRTDFEVNLIIIFNSKAIDTKNEGLISTSDFKMVLFKANIGLSLNEINRFSRYIPKDSNLMIDYIKFVKNLEAIKTEEELEMMSSNPEMIRTENLNIIK